MSCLQGAKAPAVTPTRTLTLEGDPSGVAGHKEFGVVFAGPKGETVDPSEVSIVWNRPMRALELAGEEARPPATILAAGGRVVKGSWRWMGTSAAIFAPEDALPRATEYSVTVPQGTRALDGSTLAAAYAFSFTTPRPRLERVQPGEEADHLTPSQTFELRFNQPIDPKEVERAGKLLVGGDAKTSAANAAKAVAFRATRPKADVPMLVQLTPATPLPLDSRVVLSFDASLHGTEGLLPTGTPRNLTMHTYGPLRAVTVDCFKDMPHKKCSARDSVRVELSNRVSFKEWKAHLRVEPATKIDWGTLGDDANLADWETLPVHLKPARGYRVIVAAGMKDEFGQTLARDAVLPFETDDEWPQFEVGVAGTVFESGTAAKGKNAKARAVPIASVNLASYELVTAAVDEADLARFLLSGNRGRREDFAAVEKLAQAKKETVRPAAATNVQSVKRVDLDALLAAAKKGDAAGNARGNAAGATGVVIVAVRGAERRGESRAESHELAVTDLGITAKMSRFGSVVAVNRLSDGKAVAGATVSIRRADGSKVVDAKSDASGLVVIPPERYSPVRPDGQPDDAALVTARLGDDWSYRTTSDMLSPWRYQPSSDPSGRLVPFGMLITDRGIYKAGETVRVKGIFRRPLPRGTETPVGQEVHFEAYDSQGEKVLEKSMRLGSFGDFAVDVPLAKAVRLGTLELRAELPAGAGQGDRQGTASATVEVAAYRAAEFKVTVEPDRPSYIRGDKATFVVRGDYLYGAPMSGGATHFTVTRGPGSFTPPGIEPSSLILGDDAYSWDLEDTSARAGELEAADGQLSPKGDFSRSVSLALPHQRGTEVVSFEAEVADLNRQTIAGRASAIVHPGEFYVAMQPPKETFVAKGQPVPIVVGAIEPAGKLRAGVPVRVDLVRRTWHTVVETSGESGMHMNSKPVDAVVASCTVTTKTELSSCAVAPAEAGFYIVHATAKDPRGNAVASSTFLYALGEGDGIGWSATDTSKLDLVTNKKSYEVGDVATILVKNPYQEAEALVTVERAGVYRQERRTLKGPMPTIQVPITPDLRPNAYVAVHLLRGRTKDAPARGGDVGAPSFRLGYAEIVVNPEARRLKVAIQPQKRDLRPGEVVDADVTVTDRAGKGVKSNVTFYAVDEGVLMLTGYKTPDPIPVFTAPRPLSVWSLETRDDLAKILLTSLGNSGSDKGGEGGGGGSELRQDFRATAYFEPSLVAAEGKAHVRFKLPDNLTTYRLMAVVAAEDDRFGYGEEQITASRKLMARPALPRFLRAGDSMDAGIVLASKGMGATSVEVTASAEGVTLGAEAKKTIALPANGSVEVRWPFTAPTAGQAKIAFRARGGAETDAVEVVRDVSTPTSMEAVALYGSTTEAVGERLGDIRSMRSDVGGLDLRLSSTALVGLDEGVEQLLDYPYGCTEQLTSRLVPLAALGDLARDYGVKLPKDVGAMVGDAVAKVMKNQRDDGSFGYWVDSPSSDPWVTAYALWGLTTARQHGYAVPAKVTEDATTALRKMLGRDTWVRANYVASAFIVDVLAVAGNADPGYTALVFDHRAELPQFARALLAHAMIVAKLDPKGVKELVQDFDNHLRVSAVGATVVDNTGDKYAVLLDSEARTTALVLRALIAFDPKSELAARIAKGLLAMRHGGTWRTTQETAWSLVSLDDYRRAQEARSPDFDARVFLGDTLVTEAGFHERSVKAASSSFAADKLFRAGASGSTLAFEVNGSGTLFYEARLRYAKQKLPTEPLDRGFFVRKLVRSVRPEGLAAALATVPEASASSARGGDLVLVDLFVVNPDPRESVVIDDPLPAGLEAVQSNLATSARSATVTDPGDERDGRDEGDDEQSQDDARAAGHATTFAWYHREIHDDRVLTFVEHMPAGIFHYRYLARATTFGKFIVPPTRAECMYEPETFGRTAATTFEVRP